MTASTRRTLARDSSGAIMVMGVFMAALMVGFIYYVKGIGQAIVFRERMQDAADSAAFASAAVHARGMNLVAMTNISMAGVVAVVAATDITRTVAMLGAFESRLGAPDDEEPLRAIQNQAGGHFGETYRPLFRVLRASNTAANAVASAIPAAAEARAVGAATSAFRPPVEAAFAYPSFPRLPVEPGPIDDLAGRAGPTAAGLAAIPLGPYPYAMGYLAPYADPATAIRVANRVLRSIGSASTIEGMMPQRPAANVVQGGDRLQLRVVVGGSYDFALPERGIEVATWGQSEAASQEQRALMLLSRIAIAQAEYYYAGPGGREEWLWTQNWHARLRRVRLGNPGGYPCLEASAYCDALDRMFQRGLEDAVVH